MCEVDADRKEPRQALRTAVLVAEPPALPIPRGSAGPGPPADTIVKRWQDHLPLHRMEHTRAAPTARHTPGHKRPIPASG